MTTGIAFQEAKHPPAAGMAEARSGDVLGFLFLPLCGIQASD
jgi:hypothetical protein